MPEISRFRGIFITMNWDDHNPPHFHAEYGAHEALFTFDGEVLSGKLPPKQTKLVSAWAVMHEEELIAEWGLAEKKAELFDIEPLK